MNRLMIRLWGIIEGESVHSINYQIAKTLIMNITQIRNASQSELAKLCHVSKPSISRFCKLVGYEDFLDFRADLLNFFPDRGSKFLLKEPNKDLNWIESYLNEVQANMDNFSNPMFQEQLIKLIDDIAQFDSVYMFGNIQSGRTAENILIDLHNYKKNIEAITSYKEQTEMLRSMKKNALYLIFSVSGEYFRVLFQEDAAPKHPEESKVWLITTNPLIHRLSGVDELLNCKTGSGLAGANLSMEIMGHLISLGYWYKQQ